MSYCGALPTGESESHLLIDACLRGVREEARLDDDPVLPPLSSIRRNEMVKPIEVPSPSTGSSETSTRSVWRRSEVSLPDLTTMTPLPLSRASADEETVTRRPRSLAQRMRWPVFLCGFVAGIFGGIALMKSPVGRRPAVQHVVKATQRQAVAVYGVVAVKAGLARP
jgi:hypothetical protein